MVHSVCRRQMRDEHLAEDVTQAVFIILAKKAATIPPHVVLGAWLFRTALFTCANARRMESTQQTHIRQVKSMGRTLQFDDPANGLNANEIDELLDRALLELGKTERDIVILRFYQDMSVNQISKTLDITTYAVETKLAKSLKHLRRVLSTKGLAATAVALASVLGTRSAHAAPESLVSTIAGNALQGTTTAASGPVTQLVGNTLRKMAFAKLRIALATAAIAMTITVGIASAIALNRRTAPPPPLAAPSSPAPVWAPAAPATVAQLASVLKTADRALRTMNAAELDSCAAFSDEDQSRHWKILWDVLAADHHLKASVTSHLSPTEQPLTPLPDFATRLDQTLPLVSPGDIQWAIAADRAVVHFSYLPETAGNPPGGSIYFLRHANQWKIDATLTLAVAIEGLDNQGRRTNIDQLPFDQGQKIALDLAALAATLQNVAAQIDAGQTRDPNQLRDQLASAAHASAANPDRAFFRIELLCDQNNQPRITP
jgi:RNA polymerase sigma factor (sigma-70 family)